MIDHYYFDKYNLYPEMGSWLSVDPLAEKNQSVTPYNYCHNNPVMLVDPDGREIVVHYKGKLGFNRRFKIKNNGDIEKLSKIESKNDFAKNVGLTLDYLKDEALVQEAISTKTKAHVLEAKESTHWFNPIKQRNEIEYNPKEALEMIENSEVNKSVNEREGTGEFQTPAMGFFHELGHFIESLKVADRAYNDSQESIECPFYDNCEEERVIVHHETPAAKRLGEGTRTNHSGIPYKVKSPVSLEGKVRVIVPTGKNPRSL